jgi:hypothetical protein
MRIKQIMIAFDQLINAILGGYAQETLSARCWRLRDFQPYKTLRPVIDWAFRIWGPDHCENSFKNRLGYLPDNQFPTGKP